MENPDAIVIRSLRDSADAWWRSADRTIFENLRTGDRDSPGLNMIRTLLQGNIGSYDDAAVAKAAYARHNAGVLEPIPPDRLASGNRKTDGNHRPGARHTDPTKALPSHRHDGRLPPRPLRVGRADNRTNQVRA